MKTLHDIKLMFAECQDQGSDLKRRTFSDKSMEKTRKRQLKVLQTKASQLKTVILYLETNPHAEFLQKEVTRLTGRKNAIMQYRPVTHSLRSIKKWEKEQGIENINKQLKALKFILS